MSEYYNEEVENEEVYAEVSNKKLALSKPQFMDWYDIDKDTTFCLFDTKHTISRPMFCGMAILGISKSYMIESWYKLVDKYGYVSDNNEYGIQLIFTDTDSLVFSITAPNARGADLYADIYEDQEFASMFDMSGFDDEPIPSIHIPEEHRKIMKTIHLQRINIGAQLMRKRC